MVLAIFAFVGFESAGALGQEAKNPARSVPRAIIWSCGIIGVFYLIVVYAQIYGFGDAAFGKATAPLPQLAVRRRPRRARPLHRDRHHLLDVRLRAGLPDRGLADAAVPRARRPAAQGLHAHLQAHPRAGRRDLGGGDPDDRHPRRLHRRGLSDAGLSSEEGTLATYGFMLAYGLVALAAPIYLRKLSETKPLAWVLGVLGAVTMLFVFYVNWIPRRSRTTSSRP